MADRAAAGVTYSRPVDIEAARHSQLRAFMDFCQKVTGREFADHRSFYRFSVAEFRAFWSSLLTWSGIVFEGSPDVVCVGDDVEHATFFPELRLNYVENLLATHSELDDRPALVARRADGTRVELTRRELREQVLTVAAAFARDGLRAGDRVVAISSNSDRLVVAGLAALAVGATLSTAAPDMGVDSVLSRFAPLSPTVLLCESGGAETRERLHAVIAGLATLQRVVVLDDADLAAGLPVETVSLAELTSSPAASFRWPRLPFNHPLFILFSSGTTGPPKCIVHSAGGTLLEHVKEHRLHGDLRPDDVLFFQTSPAWMMWNWQLSALAVGARIVVNAGPVIEPAALWSVVEAEQVSVFGTSPAYLRLCEVAGFSPRAAYPMARLRLLMSTGAVLADVQYDRVAQHVGDIPIHSISGGTDIVGCFVLGAPDLPIRRGETQCRSLGLDVRALRPDAAGIGELVCCNPFPSRPTGLYGDPDGSRFHRAYFAANEGMWTHGDLIEITDRGSARMHGRSDSVLNIDGNRIGPAEVYAIVNRVDGVAESLAVEQRVDDDSAETSRLVLLVVMTEPGALDAAKQAEIRAALRLGASASHVPRVIAEVADLPRTFSGKPSESAMRAALNGEAIRNAGALRNPQSLDDAVEAVRRAESRAGMAPVAEHSLVAKLCAVFADVLGVDEVRPGDSFFDLGGTSLMLASVRRVIYDRLGYDLPMSSIFQAPRAYDLAQSIEGSDSADTLVLLRPGRGRPIFAIHDGSGDVLAYRPLAASLASDRPVFGIRARGIDGRTDPDESVAAMARSAIGAIRATEPAGPYSLLGYSFGGIVAFEAARALRESGDRVENLILIDPYLDPRSRGRLNALWFLYGYRTVTWFLGWFGPRRRDSLHALRSRIGRLMSRWRRAAPGRQDTSQSTPLASAFWDYTVELTHRYRPGPFDGDATILLAGERFAFRPNFLPRWQEAISGEVHVVRVAGDHSSIVADAVTNGVVDAVDQVLLSGVAPAVPQHHGTT